MIIIQQCLFFIIKNSSLLLITKTNNKSTHHSNLYNINSGISNPLMNIDPTTLSQPQLKQYIDQAFLKHDKDRDGTLNTLQMANFLTELFHSLGYTDVNVSPQEAQEAIQMIDRNNDNRVTKMELFLAMRQLANSKLTDFGNVKIFFMGKGSNGSNQNYGQGGNQNNYQGNNWGNGQQNQNQVNVNNAQNQWGPTLPPNLPPLGKPKENYNQTNPTYQNTPQNSPPYHTQPTWGQQQARGSGAGSYQQQARGSGAQQQNQYKQTHTPNYQGYPSYNQPHFPQSQAFSPQFASWGTQPILQNAQISNNLVWGNGSGQPLIWGVPGQRPGTPPSSAYTVGYQQVPVYYDPYYGGYMKVGSENKEEVQAINEKEK